MSQNNQEDSPTGGEVRGGLFVATIRPQTPASPMVLTRPATPQSTTPQATPQAQLVGGYVNPFNGESSGRVLGASEAFQRPRPSSSGAGGKATRVKDIQKRISQLERSAMQMYTQHAGAALALEREVAQLREERIRLGGAAPVSGQPRPQSAPGSGNGLEGTGPRERAHWLMPSNHKMRQSSASERLSKPGRRPGTGSFEATALVPKSPVVRSAREQAERAARLSTGVKAHQEAWESDTRSMAITQRVATPVKGNESLRAIARSPIAAQARAQAAMEDFVKTANEKPQTPNKKAQADKMSSLSSPTKKKDKVVTEGIAKSSVDWTIHLAKQSPGPGQYNIAQSERPPSGGKFNHSNPKSDVEVRMDRARAVPGPGQYKIPGVGSGAGGRKFSTAKPLSDVDVKIATAKTIPGPGQYGQLKIDTKGNAMLKNTGAGFSTSMPLSDVDVMQMRAKQIPGPGQYKLKGTSEQITGGTFSNAKPKSDLDWKIYEAGQKPGPGSYNIPSSLQKGQRFSTANPKSDLDFKIIEATKKPGPGHYMINDHMTRPSSHTGKFPFVYKPKDPTKAHLAKC
eukprot:CAMPEP_0172614980 /NCGR_PEP_ID=MMETSP1068-20121228/55745_1 /TAXON_ID=35684 /ORGANISM="Pseudopedinella elastica, Strain CCMP716" /LENGTH=569 /DNA_ID=CAMNT_0013419959 /DNA_START=120 /DNA_END=1829 /DNA_ORIENTATION=-